MMRESTDWYGCTYPVRPPNAPDVVAWLADAERMVMRDRIEPDVLLTELDELRRRTSERVWRDEVVPTIRQHELYEAAMECPFSRRATDKPRGYAGDALLLDFLYRRPSVAPLLEASTDRGRQLCDFWAASPAARAVRARRDLLREKIDALGQASPGAAVLAVACGHLTEATDSPAARAGAFRRFVAFDQDAQSLAHIDRYGRFPGLELVSQRVKALLGPGDGERFDLIYAAGLYDYLPTELAQRLTARLFERLVSGGELVIGNFLPSTPNIASMDVFQDWRLIYRTRAEIEELAVDVPDSELAAETYLTDGDGCIGMLILRRQ